MVEVTRQSLTDGFHCMRLPRFVRNDGFFDLVRGPLDINGVKDDDFT